MITVAVAKGRLLAPTQALLRAAGLRSGLPDPDDRRLLIPPEGEGEVQLLIARAWDVPTFVEHGAAELGICGKDVLWERQPQVEELADLGFGRGRLVLAGPRQGPVPQGRWRIATKFPAITERYFRAQGRQVEVIALRGGVEIAPMLGLADAIVDFTETGRTLAAHDLVVWEELGWSTARLIANPVGLRLRGLQPLWRAIEAAARAQGVVPC